jgi:hypothetical protein
MSGIIAARIRSLNINFFASGQREGRSKWMQGGELDPSALARSWQEMQLLQIVTISDYAYCFFY